MVEAIKKMNIKTVSYIRVWLQAIMLGWRVVGGALVYNSKCRDEERNAGVTALQKTTGVLKELMNGISGWKRRRCLEEFY